MNELELNKTVVLKLLQAIGTGDTETVKSLITDDIVFTTSGTSIVSGTRGYDEVVAAPAGLMQITKSGIRFETENLTAEADRVAVQANGYSELVNGVAYNNQYHHLFLLRDGKVYKFFEYMDTLLAEKTLGPLFAGA